MKLNSLETLEYGSFNDRVSLGMLTQLSGVYVPSMTVLYPDKDIWFHEDSQVTPGDSLNLSIFPEYTNISTILSILNATDPQRIPIALQGGATEEGMWGFSLNTRRKILHKYSHSLPSLLYTYVSLSYKDIPWSALKKTIKDTGYQMSDINKRDMLYNETSRMTYNNRASVSELLQNSTYFLYLEYATCVNLKNFINDRQFLEKSTYNKVIDSVDSTLPSLKNKLDRMMIKDVIV